MKHWLTLIAVFATLGVIVNVLVSWWFVVVDARETGPQTWRAGDDQRHWPSPPPGDWPDPTRRVQRCFRGWRHAVAYRVPAELEPGGQGRVIVTHSMTVRQYGWPLLSLESRWLFMPARTRAPDRTEPASAMTIQQGVLLCPSKLQAAVPRLVFFPVRPMLAGFAANSMLFAAALWLLLAIPRAVRRVIRRRRGQCPPCGYDLRGFLAEGCSECGWRRSQPGTSVFMRDSTGGVGRDELRQ